MELAIQNINIPREYGVSDAKIAEIAEKYKDLREIKDPGSRAMASAGRKECRELRVAVEHKRKELKADALEYGRRVDGEAKRITEKLREIEEPLDALIKADEARREEEKQAKLRAIAEAEAKERARVDEIKAKIEGHFGASAVLALHSMAIADLAERLETAECVAEMGDDYAEFTEEAHRRREEFLEKARQILAEKREAEAAAEAQRAEAERLAEERRQFEEEQRIAREKAEAEQRAREEKERQEQEERERNKAEILESLRKAEEELEAEKRKLREEQEAIEAEKRRIEEDRLAKIRAEEEEKRRKELAEEARLRAEKEFKEAQERKERERRDREEAERMAQEREEMLRPDREKLKLFAGSLVAMPFPTLTTAEGHKAMARIEKKIDALAEFVVAQAEKMAEFEEDLEATA